MAHLHITSWVIAFILLAIVVSLSRKGNAKGAKITHMILRVDYLLILYSGGNLFASYSTYGPLVIIKVLAGLWAIASIEMIAIKTTKKQPARIWWIQFVIAVVLALILGFGYLPMGILPA